LMNQNCQAMFLLRNDQYFNFTHGTYFVFSYTPSTMEMCMLTIFYLQNTLVMALRHRTFVGGHLGYFKYDVRSGSWRSMWHIIEISTDNKYKQQVIG
jgi:hypothetical protein